MIPTAGVAAPLAKVEETRVFASNATDDDDDATLSNTSVITISFTLTLFIKLTMVSLKVDCIHWAVVKHNTS